VTVEIIPEMPPIARPAPPSAKLHPAIAMTREWWLLIPITAFGAALRIYGLSSKPFWLDEAISVHISRLPWREFISTLSTREANMALYYALLRLWLQIGHSEPFIRSLSVLFSIATIPLLYAAASQLFDPVTGVVSALFLSLNAFHIRYAQEARGYAMVMFFSVLATWLLARNHRQPGRTRWGAYVAACTLAVYCHFYGVFVIVAHAGALLCCGCARSVGKPFLRRLALIALCITPLGIFVLRSGGEPLSWVQPVTPAILLRFGFDFAGNYGAALLALSIVAIGFAVLAAHRTWRERRNSEEGFGYACALCWLLAPLALVVLASLIHPVFVTRFLSPSMPAMSILVAAGIVRTRPRALAIPLLGCISALALAGVFSYYRADFDVVRGDWRQATRFVLDQTRPGDTIFFYQPYGVAPFEFYQRQFAPASSWPAVLDPPVTASDRPDPNLTLIPGTTIGSLPPGDRVWLVWFMLPAPGGATENTSYVIRDWFSRGRHRLAAQMFPGVSVTLLGRE
jgi:mannosyltransferase